MGFTVELVTETKTGEQEYAVTDRNGQTVKVRLYPDKDLHCESCDDTTLLADARSSTCVFINAFGRWYNPPPPPKEPRKWVVF